MPFGCFAVCHATCSSSSFLTVAPMSFTQLCSFLPPFHFNTPCSQPTHFLGWASSTHTQAKSQKNAPAWKAISSLGSFPFHSSFIHFSSVQSTRYPCIACLPATVCVQETHWHKTHAHKPLAYATFISFTVRPSLPLVALLSAPSSGTRRQLHSFVISLAYVGTQCPCPSLRTSVPQAELQKVIFG